MEGSLKESDLGEHLRWFMRLRKRFRVTGASMIPSLKPGEEVLVDLKAYQKENPQVGEIVVANHPRDQNLKIIKRVAAAHKDGSCDLIGDNPKESTNYSTVPADQILGRVTSRFS